MLLLSAEAPRCFLGNLSSRHSPFCPTKRQQPCLLAAVRVDNILPPSQAHFCLLHRWYRDPKVISGSYSFRLHGTLLCPLMKSLPLPGNYGFFPTEPKVIGTQITTFASETLEMMVRGATSPSTLVFLDRCIPTGGDRAPHHSHWFNIHCTGQHSTGIHNLWGRTQPHKESSPGYHPH